MDSSQTILAQMQMGDNLGPGSFPSARFTNILPSAGVQETFRLAD